MLLLAAETKKLLYATINIVVYIIRKEMQISMLHSMSGNVASFPEEEPRDLFEDRGKLAALDDS